MPVKVLGDALPQGRWRLAANLLMLVAILAASVGAGMSIWANIGWAGVGLVAALVVLAIVIPAKRQPA